MLEDRSAATSDGRPAGSAKHMLLTRIQEGLATTGPARTRHCPCCGQALRAGQRITTIHGTSVHVRCASPQR